MTIRTIYDSDIMACGLLGFNVNNNNTTVGISSLQSLLYPDKFAIRGHRSLRRRHRTFPERRVSNDCEIGGSRDGR